MRDEPAERRIAIARCDVCDVREHHFYDIYSLTVSRIEWEHEWRTVSFGGPELAFCSADCLDQKLAAIKELAYREAAVVT